MVAALHCAGAGDQTQRQAVAKPNGSNRNDSVGGLGFGHGEYLVAAGRAEPAPRGRLSYSRWRASSTGPLSALDHSVTQRAPVVAVLVEPVDRRVGRWRRRPTALNRSMSQGRTRSLSPFG